MKKILTCSVLVLLSLALLLSLCSCFETGVEASAKTADRSIERSDKAGGYFSEADYETSLEYDEETDTYVYTVNIYRPEEQVNSPASISRSLHLNIDGYFDEYDNVTVLINVYNGLGEAVYIDTVED